MGAKILNVKKFAKKWKEDLRIQVDEIGRTAKRKPSLTIVQVGDNPASTKYVDNKIKDCKEVGINVDLFRIPEDVDFSQKELENLVFNCETDGIIIQLPLPSGLDGKKALQYCDFAQDVDGFLVGSPHIPATPLGTVTYLDSLGIDYDGKVALVIGRSELVGKPVGKLLLDRNCTLIQAHSKTKKEDLDKYLREADIVVCAVGKEKFLDLSAAKDGATIVDVGINFDENGKMVGDCWNHENGRGQVTPVPGGVGLLTRCALLENVVRSWKEKLSLR